MNPDRFVITDTVWAQISPVLSGKSTDCGVTAKDTRLFLEAVLWRVRTGSPWRDLPTGFGNWNSTFTRFRRWAKSGVFERIFERLSGDADFEYVMVDGTIVSVHQKASGAKGGPQNQAIGRSRGGLTTKIVALVDALGNLIRFTLLPGQRHDLLGVMTLIEDVEFKAFLGDKAFDANWLRDELMDRKASVVIPSKSNRKSQIPHDKEVYKWRHLVENYFAKIKEFRGIATRYDKTDVSYIANWNLAAGIIAAR
ncbi:MAG: IS5 family transposase [Magnetovibrio sp.]|nr:IS5 family transposase [Magnetovibrio sp.]